LGLKFQDDHGQASSQDMTLRGLAFELKNPLINIARLAELNDADSYDDIQHTAEQSLQLIDSYLLNAQTEYGQTMLDLEPVSIGSVLYDVSSRLGIPAKYKNASLVLDDRTNELVMTHRPALTSALYVFGKTIMGFNDSNLHQEITLRGYKTRRGRLGIGLFSKSPISKTDLTDALKLQGTAHMPMSRISSESHVSLAIADGLCRAIGGKMTVKHMGGLSGLATELPPSEQLAFV
jgi:hypothetical protein